MSFLDLVTPWEGKATREGKKEIISPKNLGNCAECGARMIANEGHRGDASCPVCEDFDRTLKEMEYLSKERDEI